MKHVAVATDRDVRREARRGGFTLIELLVVLTVFTFLLAIVALALGTLLRAQGELQNELVAANTSARLATQLRADAHLANSADLTRQGDTTTVRLLLPKAEIHYMADTRRITRTVTQDGERTHREVFSLLEGTTADWKLSTELPAFITLSTSYVSPVLRAGVARPREHHIQASIGLHTGGVQ